MKRKLLLISLISAMILSGCGNTDQSADEFEAPSAKIAAAEAPTEEAEPAEEEEEDLSAEETTETAAPEIKIIGTEKEGDSVYKVKFRNDTEKSIVGFTVKADSETDYPENMMNGDDVFETDQERVLYYDTENIPETANSGSDEDTPVISTQYIIKITFDDNTSAELHQFPFGDIEEGTIKYEDNVLFIVYESKLSGTEVSTKEAEIMIQQQTEETVETTAAETEEATTEPETEPEEEEITEETEYYEQEEPEQIYVEAPAVQEPVQTPVIPAEQPVVETPAEVPAEQPVVETPAEVPAETPAEPDDPNNGCIGGGGLFY